MGGMLDFLNDSESDYFGNPKRVARELDLTDNYDTSSPLEQRNYLDDNFGSFTSKLPIDQPNGSIVSGGREDLYHKYSQMLEQEPASKHILDDYLGRRPTDEQYKPGIGRKIIAGLAGLGSAFGRGGPASGYAVTDKILHQPLNDAMEEYQQEGKFIDVAMRQADSTRNQQMAGILNQIRQEEQGKYNQGRLELQQGAQKLAQQRLDQQNADRLADNARREREFQANERYRQAILRLRSLHGGGDTEDKLSPFQKQGLKTYENLTKPQKADETNDELANIIHSNPDYEDLFENDPNAKTVAERNTYTPRTDLTPDQQAVVRQILDKASGKYRLLDSLGFGQDTPYPMPPKQVPMKAPSYLDRLRGLF